MRNLYANLALLIIIIIVIGSPLSSFGCQTAAPDHFNMPCETNLGGTAVQSNFVNLATTTVTLSVVLAFICWLIPQHLTPQELHLLPPYPPPRNSQV
ncbi:MAG: hypothetical protein KC445_18470 [Anaerolineales bacterium]|nr:hypothetical protein [Anaerolineales bacterium]